MFVLWLISMGLFVLAASVIDPELLRIKPPGNNNCVLGCNGQLDCFSEFEKCVSILHHYNLSSNDNAENEGLRKLLLHGHNGLRNRFAEKLNLCDMLQIRWNDKLAAYANRHHIYCHAQTNFSNFMCDSQYETDVYRGYYGKRKDFKPSRNGFFYPNTYSANFIPFALSNWYESHTKLESPKAIKLQNDSYYVLIGGNNSFFNMVNPNTQVMGCSIATFAHGRSLICYYYPFIHYEWKYYLRILGESYRCPHNYPIFDPVFKRICINI